MEWLEFKASGFSGDACGVIHKKSSPAVCGMPLGGIGTGCIDFETDGTFGYCTIFNSHVPRRGPLNSPFLGIAVGHESWVLSAMKLKSDPMGQPMGQLNLRRAKPVDDILYWGHYPVADVEYVTDCPVNIGMRAWSPFIPGDAGISNTPAVVFELRLKNTKTENAEGMLAFSFPGPSSEEVNGDNDYEHVPVLPTYKGKFAGVWVNNKSGNQYFIGFIGEEKYRTGGDLGIDGKAWSRLSNIDYTNWSNKVKTLPPETRQSGASVGVDFELKPGEEKTVRFVLTWYSPVWKGGGNPAAGGNSYYNMYAGRYKDAVDVAQTIAGNHESLLSRIIAWQEAIYSEKILPVWLRESLVNILHLLTEDSFWAQAEHPIGNWCRKEDGLFGLSEDPRTCPQIECIPCSFYGNIPLVYFFPGLALSTLRGYKAYQYPDGQAPWVFGGITCGTPFCEMAMPSRGYSHKPQTTLDGSCYAVMIDRMWRRAGDKKILEEFYQSMKKNAIFTMNLRPESGLAGIVSMPSGNNGQDWMESCDLYGIVPHIGGVHLAHLKIAERMAEEMGDKGFAEQCREWFKQGSKILEEKTWNEKYYLLYYEEETGKKSDIIMGCQLDGDWIARTHGLDGVFKPERVKTTLNTLAETNVMDKGVIVFKGTEASKDFNPGYWTYSGVHLPSSLMLAMTYIYNGEPEYGIDLAYRTIKYLVLESRCSWNSTLLYRGDTGERLYGLEYYQNLVLWALPSALYGQDIAGLCKPDGLVDRIIKVSS